VSSTGAGGQPVPPGGLRLHDAAAMGLQGSLSQQLSERLDEMEALGTIVPDDLAALDGWEDGGV
jgi:hypothetical protein